MFSQFLLSCRHDATSIFEKSGDFLLQPTRAIFGGKNIVILNTGVLKIEEYSSISNMSEWIQTVIKVGVAPLLFISTGAGALIKSCCLIDSQYRATYFRDISYKLIKNPDKLNDNTYIHLFTFLSTFKEKVMLVLDARQNYDIPTSSQQAIRIVSRLSTSLSYSDIQELMDTLENLPVDGRKTLILNALEPKILTSLTVDSNILDENKFKALIGKCPKLATIIFDPKADFYARASVLNLINVLLEHPHLSLKELHLEGASISDNQLIQFLLKFPNLKKLYYPYCFTISESFWINFPAITQLEELDLHRINTTGENLIELLRKCPHLKKLNLSEAELTVPEDNLENIPSLALLEDLNLSKVAITEEILKGILQKTPRIKKLNLKGCRHISGESLTDIPHLEELKELILRDSSITDRGLATVLSKCPNLKIIDLYNCSSITGNLLTNLPKFEDLTESDLRLTKMREVGLQNFLQSCLNIKVFSCTLDGSSTNAMWEKIPDLLELAHLTISGPPSSSEVKSLFQKCPKIKHLNMRGCQFEGENFFADIPILTDLVTFVAIDTNITGRQLQNLLKNSPCIKEINLNFCKSLTGEDLDADLIFSTIENLNLSYSTITKGGLENFLRKCINLKHLNLQGCNRLYNLGELENIPELVRLEELDLSEILFHRTLLYNFVHACSQLKMLNIHRSSITNNDVEFLLEKLPNIKRLIFSEVENDRLGNLKIQDRLRELNISRMQL